jgi:hypothetical protein
MAGCGPEGSAMKLAIAVNGVLYDTVEYDPATRTIGLYNHSVTPTERFYTTFDELKTQYGVKTAFFVRDALRKRGAIV